MKRILILSLAVSLISFVGFSQNIDKAKLDTYFDTLASNNRFKFVFFNIFSTDT